MGSDLILEGFAERGYSYDGTLIRADSRETSSKNQNKPRGRRWKLAPRVGTICIHGDSPNAVAIARAVRVALEEAGYEIGA